MAAELNTEKFEDFIAEYPIYEYRLLDTKELSVAERVRIVCKQECERYGTTWACPPAVGTVEACRNRVLSYPGALVFTSLAEVSDIADMAATLATRGAHEALTRQVRDILLQFSPDVLTLSTESCAICTKCAYPDAPCRHPDRMFPCVESYGIVATALAERNGIEFYNGNLVTWFSVLCYR